MDIQIEGLHKSYADKKVLDNISFDLKGGTCFGLIGNNGAGKSTLINILIDVVQPDAGTVKISGMTYENDSLKIRRKIGILPEASPINDELTGYEQLWLVGLLYGISITDLTDRIESLFSFFFDDMEDLYRRCDSYSTGMRQKLGIIAALMHKPEMLILDEPFAGLDPSSSYQLLEFLSSYMRNDRVIFLSSHNLSYVEKVANRIGVLNKQHMVYDGDTEKLTENGTKLIEKSLFDLIQPEHKDEGGLQWLIN